MPRYSVSVPQGFDSTSPIGASTSQAVSKFQSSTAPSSIIAKKIISAIFVQNRRYHPITSEFTLAALQTYDDRLLNPEDTVHKKGPLEMKPSCPAQPMRTKTLPGRGRVPNLYPAHFGIAGGDGSTSTFDGDSHFGRVYPFIVIRNLEFRDSCALTPVSRVWDRLSG